ncbi:MAG: AAA family ATPase [Deltaproteobacteria bacterium]|nr:AAA family ATPase [Deltaproteobacteria bacterium]
MNESCPHETQVNDPFHHTCKDCREQVCGHHQVALHIVKALIEDGEAFTARMAPTNMKYLHLEEGDYILLQGQEPAVVPVRPSPPVIGSEAVIHLDPLTLRNAGANLFNKVIVQKALALPAEEVTLLPEKKLPGKDDREKALREQLGQMVVLAGNQIRLHLGGDKSVYFRVQATRPEGPVRIEAQTDLMVQDPQDVSVGDMPITYHDIGGLEKEIERIREIVELPLRFPKIFQRLGIEAPKGILLHGPPGSGKTLIARAVAQETQAVFYHVNGPEIMQRHYGESEEKLRSIFEKAQAQAPAIIFLDEIDALAPRREKAEGEVEKRIVAQLLALMDGLESRGPVVVMGATNIPNALDPALRRPGRFDREISITVPDERGRLRILQIHSRRMPLAEGVDLAAWAKKTHGFVGADLKALCQEAGIHTLRRIMPRLDRDPDQLSPEFLENLVVEGEDFELAFQEVEPSAIREVQVELPQVHWDQVGGCREAKKSLKEAFEWPWTFPERYAALGLTPPKGILITGPAGTGKTLIVQALARESGLNFIAIKGPELLSKYVGESEERIREIFRKARLAAPCILFFDELDSFAVHRGLDQGSARVTSRMVSQLLTEMDGIEKLKGVFIIGATSQPGIMDPSLLRPGRFELRIILSLPDREERKEIFGIHLRTKPLAPEVTLDWLAEQTEGWNGAQIEALCRQAALSWFREGVEQGWPADREVVLARGHFEPVFDKP